MNLGAPVFAIRTRLDIPDVERVNAVSFGVPCRVLFRLVLPPVLVSKGSPVSASLLNNAHLVALAAAASFRGHLACFCSSGCPNSEAPVYLFSILRDAVLFTSFEYALLFPDVLYTEMTK